MSAISLIEALVPRDWPILVLVTARVIGLMLMAPMWSMPTIPRNVRVALAVTVSLALLPSTPRVALPEQMAAFPIALAMELLVGLAIGLTGSLFLYGLAIAGEVTSVQMGLAIAAALGQVPELGSPGIGGLKNLMAIAIYFLLGGHLILLWGLADSFQAIPPGTGIDYTRGGEAFVMTAGTLFVTAVKVAAPLMAAMMLANTVIGILSKAVPQLNILMVAFPLTIGLGFIVFGASLPFLATVLTGWVEELPRMLRATTDSFVLVPRVP